MNHSKRLILFVICCLISIFAVQSQVYESSNNEDRTYRVGIVVDNYPLSFEDDNGEIRGFAWDLLTEVAQLKRLKFEIVKGRLPQLLGLLEKGELDLIHPLPRLSRWNKIVNFSASCLVSQVAIFYHKSLRRIGSIEDLKDKKGVISTNDISETIIKSASFDRLVLVGSIIEAIRKVNFSDGDFTIAPRVIGIEVIKKYGFKNVGVKEIRIPAYSVAYCIGIRIEDKKLIADINDAIASLTRTGKTEQLYDKWFGSRTYTQEDVFRALSFGLGVALIIAIIGGIFVYKKAKMARESESKFRSLVQSAPYAIFLLRNGLINYANDKVFDVFGYKVDEILEKSPLDFSPHIQSDGKTSLDKFNEITSKVNNEGWAVLEWDFIRKDGSIGVAELNITKTLINGKLYLLASARDITSYKQLLERLQDSERSYRELVENAVTIIMKWSLDGRLTFLNEFGQKLTGRSAQELLGANIVEVFNIDLNGDKALSQIIEKLKADCKTQIYTTCKHKLKLGQEVIIAWTHKGIMDEKGQLKEIMSIGQDITERVRQTERIKELLQFIENSFKSIKDGIAIFDKNGYLLMANSEFERLAGEFPKGEKIYHTEFKLCKETKKLKGKCNFEIVAESLQRFEIEIQIGEQWLEVCTDPIIDENGFNGVICIVSDVTKDKQLQAQYLRAQRLEAIGALAAGIAHDINNILTPILMSSSMLKGMVKDEALLNLINTIESCATRGANVVKQLLIYARGKSETIGPISVKPIINEIALLLRETFPKSITINVEAQKDLWLVIADHTQIHQAIMNLCINARDAIEDKGLITIKAVNVRLDDEAAKLLPNAKAGDYVCISVIDTGKGIAPEHFDKIFKPFFTTKPPGKGTGLGLSTVYNIVKNHGGFVTFKSKVGEGSQFDIYLPAITIIESLSSEQIKAELGDAKSQVSQRSILVIDDEQSICYSVKLALERYGYNVIIHTNAHEALTLLSENPTSFAAIITDYDMPGIHGEELINAIYRLAPNIPIVVITGLSEGIEQNPSLLKKIFLLLPKPFNIEQLLNSLSRIIHK